MRNQERSKAEYKAPETARLRQLESRGPCTMTSYVRFASVLASGNVDHAGLSAEATKTNSLVRLRGANPFEDLFA